MKKSIGKRILVIASGIALLLLTGCSNQNTPSSAINSDVNTSAFTSDVNTPASVANSTMEALLDPDGVDGQAIVDLLPDSVTEHAVAVNQYSNESEFANTLAEMYNYYLGNYLEYYNSRGVQYDFTVGDTASVTSSDLATIQDIYREFGLDVNEAQTVTINLIVTYYGEDLGYNESLNLSVMKIENTWYLDVYSMSNDTSGTTNPANPNSSNSPLGVAQLYTNAVLNHDETSGQAILDLLPDQLTNEMISDGSFSSEAEIAEYLTSSMDSVTEAFEHMEEQGVECQIKEGTSAPVSESELSAIQEAYQEYDIDVSEAQTATIVLELTYEGQSSEQPMDVPVVKIDNDWYLDAYSIFK